MTQNKKKPKPTRQEGFYWARWKNWVERGEVVVEWDGHYWYVTGSECIATEEEHLEIISGRLTRSNV